MFNIQWSLKQSKLFHIFRINFQLTLYFYFNQQVIIQIEEDMFSKYKKTIEIITTIRDHNTSSFFVCEIMANINKTHHLITRMTTKC